MGDFKERDPNNAGRMRREASLDKAEFSFPDEYHAVGVLQLPYGNIAEPFEVWYSGKDKMSRIDYYGGESYRHIAVRTTRS